MGQSSSSYKTRSSVAAMRGDLRVNARAMLVAYTSITAWAFFARADAPPKIVQRPKRTILTRILMICILDRDFGLRRELLHILGVKRWVDVCAIKRAALFAFALGFIGVLMHTTHTVGGV